jgi:hypothetical protein
MSLPPRYINILPQSTEDNNPPNNMVSVIPPQINTSPPSNDANNAQINAPVLNYPNTDQHSNGTNFAAIDNIPTVTQTQPPTQEPTPTPTATQTQTQTQTSLPTYTDPNQTSDSNYDVVLYHEKNAYNVFSQYCLPINMSLDHNPLTLCKFGKRGCVVHRSRLLTDGENIPSLSNTVYSPSVDNYSKFKYSINDTRLVKCFYPNCIDAKTNRDKVFHFVCFMHCFKMQNNAGMKLLTIDSKDDNLVGYLRSDKDPSGLIDTMLSTDKQIILPVCSKRCFNHVEGYKDKANLTGNFVNNWERDGVNGTRCSSRVLIEWLTTEENASKYLGGCDKDGRTSSTRKETYHNILADLIEKENGKHMVLRFISKFTFDNKALTYL